MIKHAAAYSFFTYPNHSPGTRKEGTGYAGTLGKKF